MTAPSASPLFKARALMQEAARSTQPLDASVLLDIARITKNLANRVAVEKRAMTAGERRDAAKAFFRNFGIVPRT